MPSPRVIISGGGTGGHIFPAIAIANAIKEQAPKAEILFVGAQGRMEMEKVPAAGFPIEGLWISGFQRSLSLKNLMFPIKLLQSLRAAKIIIKKFKPDLVIGTGGYASGPVLRVATKMKIPTLIQEQNSYAGITNKILGKSVNKVCVAFENMDRFFPAVKIILTGNPVRKTVIEIKGKRQKALDFFGLTSDKKTILIIGGSLGAKAVNDAILPQINRFVDEGVQLIWQTGKVSYDDVAEGTKSLKTKGIKVHQFIADMDLAYAAADLVISRAGAIAVTEIVLTKKPTILVPLPSAAEDHQTKNALALTQHDAAILVSNAQAASLLTEKALELVKDEEELKKLSENIEPFGLPNSAEIIAAEALKLTNT
jgi:UDP-N-acetylglucosamine--N-acetylmuramyl-(pentapeptide) pyrophosphoryl-undecaprenol N-acetylglucosamine transferase